MAPLPQTPASMTPDESSADRVLSPPTFPPDHARFPTLTRPVDYASLRPSRPHTPPPSSTPLAATYPSTLPSLPPHTYPPRPHAPALPTPRRFWIPSTHDTGRFAPVAPDSNAPLISLLQPYLLPHGGLHLPPPSAVPLPRPIPASLQPTLAHVDHRVPTFPSRPTDNDFSLARNDHDIASIPAASSMASHAFLPAAHGTVANALADYALPSYKPAHPPPPAKRPRIDRPALIALADNPNHPLPFPHLNRINNKTASHVTTVANMPKTSTKETAKVKATASKKAPKDANKPKRALSAYMFFVQDYRDRIKSENPEATFGEVGKLLGNKWKELKPAEKKPYEDMAEKDKSRAAKEKTSYEAANGKGGKKAKKPADEEEEDDDDE